MLEVLLSEFRDTFAGIEYQVDTQTRIVNAQAFRLGGSRFIRIYGGFALHPLVNADALVFTLLHETGHHRARGRRFAADPGLACDCLADKWALKVGAAAIRRHSGRSMTLSRAFDSLDAIVGSIGVGPGYASVSLKRRSGHQKACWSGCWRARKTQLASGIFPAPAGPCYYSS